MNRSSAPTVRRFRLHLVRLFVYDTATTIIDVCLIFLFDEHKKKSCTTFFFRVPTAKFTYNDFLMIVHKKKPSKPI